MDFDKPKSKYVKKQTKLTKKPKPKHYNIARIIML